MSKNGSRRSSIVDSMRSATDHIRRLSMSSLETCMNYISNTQQVPDLLKVRYGSVFDEDVVQELRSKVIKLVKQLPSTDYDQRDLDDLTNDNDLLVRCLLEYELDLFKKTKTIDQVAPLVVDCLKMRHQAGMYDLNTNQFPRELYQLRYMFGIDPVVVNPVLYGMVGLMKKLPGWNDAIIKLALCIVSKKLYPRMIDGNRQIILVFDCSDGLQIGQLELGLKMVYTIYGCLPGVFCTVIVVNLNFFLRSGAKVLLRMFPERLRERVSFKSRDELIDLIGADKVPTFMGGTLEDIEWGTHHCPPDTPSLEDVGRRFGVSDVNIKKVKPMLEKMKHECL